MTMTTGEASGESSTSAVVTPRRTRVGRIGIYLRIMFPMAVMLPGALANFVAIYWTLQTFAHRETLVLGWRAVGGAATVLGFMLLLRVYDELKDFEIDIRLASEGDRNFTKRPHVTGAVGRDDLVSLRWWVTAVLVAINLPLGFPWPLAGFAVAFFVAWLSLHWFFIPAISKNILLAFLTHNPLSLLMAGYVVAVFAGEFGSDAVTSDAWLVVIAAWLPIAAWETSRKIRAPKFEGNYSTYSSKLGWNRAIWLPVGFLAASAVGYARIASRADLSLWFTFASTLSALIGIAACLRFRFNPNDKTSRLRPFIEVHGVVATIGLALTLALDSSVAWQ